MNIKIGKWIRPALFTLGGAGILGTAVLVLLGGKKRR